MGSWSGGMPNAARSGPTCSGTIPKYTAPSPSSTTVSKMSSAAMPVSMCQNGTGHRLSSRSFGKKSLLEVRDKLLEHGLELKPPKGGYRALDTLDEDDDDDF